MGQIVQDKILNFDSPFVGLTLLVKYSFFSSGNYIKSIAGESLLYENCRVKIGLFVN